MTKPGLDCVQAEIRNGLYIFVFDEVNPDTGQFTMLPMRQDAFACSQFVEGDYDPDRESVHLGQRVLFHKLGELVLDRFFMRLGY